MTKYISNKDQYLKNISEDAKKLIHLSEKFNSEPWQSAMMLQQKLYDSYSNLDKIEQYHKVLNSSSFETANRLHSQLSNILSSIENINNSALSIETQLEFINGIHNPIQKMYDMLNAHEELILKIQEFSDFDTIYDDVKTLLLEIEESPEKETSVKNIRSKVVKACILVYTSISVFMTLYNFIDFMLPDLEETELINIRVEIINVIDCTHYETVEFMQHLSAEIAEKMEHFYLEMKDTLEAKESTKLSTDYSHSTD